MFTIIYVLPSKKMKINKLNYLYTFKEIQYLHSIKIFRYLYKLIMYTYYIGRIIPLYALGLASSFVPRKKRLWLFGSRSGSDFTDNAKYLFLYVNKQLNDIEATWITKYKKVVKMLEKNNLPVAYVYSITAIMLCIRANIIFTTHGKNDINPALTTGCIHVELYHFVIALKKIRYDVFNHYHIVSKLKLILENPFIYFKPDYSFSSSSYASKKVISSLNLSRKSVFITGLPRTDEMLNWSIHDQEKYLNVLDGQECKNIIYYLPTFRDYTREFNYFAYGLEEECLFSFLEKTDSVLVIRYHPSDTLRSKKIPANILDKRIIFESNGMTDSFSLLKKASVLITDYSGIFVDYLLVNRPIIFANFDHEEYLNARDIAYEYHEITPGPKVDNWVLLLTHLERIVVQKKDEYMEARTELKDKIYKYHDTNSCSRVIKEINRIELL